MISWVRSRDHGLDLVGQLVLPGMIGCQIRAAFAHEGELAEVLRREHVRLDQADHLLDRRPHVPDDARDHGLRRQLGLVGHVADRRDAALRRRLDDAETLGIDHVDPGLDLSDRRFLGFGRIEERADERELAPDRLVHLLGAGAEGIGQAVDLGDRHRCDHADDIRTGQLARNHACEVGGLVNPVVEHAKVGVCRPDARAEREGHVGIVARDPAGDPLRAEGIAHDQAMTLLGIATEHPGEIARRHTLRPGVLDAELVLGPEQGHVDLVDPGLLDRGLKHRGDLERVLGGRMAAAHDDGARDQTRLQGKHPPHVAPADRHSPTLPKNARDRPTLTSPSYAGPPSALL